MYKHDLPHLFRLLLLFLVIVLAIVDVVGVWWYPPADLLALAFSSAFFSQHSDLAGSLEFCAWFGIAILAMTVKEKKDWRWLTSKSVCWQEEGELHGRANQGDAEAQYELFLLYNLPFGYGMQDLAQAAFWYRKAAEQGHAEAQYSLAHMYDENGNLYLGQSLSANSQPAHYDGSKEVRPFRRNLNEGRQAVNLAAAGAALIGNSIEETANAGEQRPSLGVAEQSAVSQEGEMSKRLWSVGPYIFGLLVLGGAATGIAAWLYRAHKVERREAEAATAKEEYAKSVVAGVMKTWQADDRWEDSLSSSGDRSRPLYSIEVEKAPIYGRPLIVYGRVEDVDESGESENSIVSIQAHTGLNLQLSLLSPPEITNAILAHKGRSSEMFVFAVKINRVEKVASPPDSSGEDYFLGHGVLLEAEPLGLWRPPKQSAQSNQ